jgi:hypothetical protein
LTAARSPRLAQVANALQLKSHLHFQSATPCLSQDLGGGCVRDLRAQRYLAPP